jgi:hypothetical protein
MLKTYKMEKKQTNWNNLTLKERLAIVNHNKQLDLYSVNDNHFAVNAFVRCKNNGVIRYITKKNDSSKFEDDGKVSGCESSPHCWYENYKMI